MPAPHALYSNPSLLADYKGKWGRDRPARMQCALLLNRADHNQRGKDMDCQIIL